MKATVTIAKVETRWEILKRSRKGFLSRIQSTTYGCRSAAERVAKDRGWIIFENLEKNS